MRKLLTGMLLLAGVAQAQQPMAPVQPSPEQLNQMQAMMARQMQMMSVLYDVRTSRLGFNETLNAIQTGAAKRGWNVGETQDMQAAMRQGGAKDAKPMKVVHLCPAGANEKLAKAGAGKAPPLPCRATVFEGKDGKIQVMRMNVSNLAKVVDGDVAKVLKEVGAEEDALYKDILR